MSQGVFQPVGQKRLTNIAVVRLKRCGKRFEVACFKNKVYDWRSGAEADLDEVLQTTAVFSNVNKGQFAKTEDLIKAFGTAEAVAICKEILAKGDLQVSERERRVELDESFRDVASVILEKCINPETNRPYTMGLIQRGLRDIHFAVDPKRSVKQQALEAIPRLEEKFPIKRAMMRLDISIPVANRQDFVRELNAADGERFEQEDLVGELFKATCLIQPGRFRAICNFVAEASGGSGKVEVVAVAAQDAAAAPPREGEAAARDTGHAERDAAATVQGPLRGGYTQVVYARGAISGIPDTWENRREMFREIDGLQAGWTVELRSRGSGSTVDAVFYSPGGDSVGAFAAARREALQASKRASAGVS